MDKAQFTECRTEITNHTFSFSPQSNDWTFLTRHNSKLHLWYNMANQPEVYTTKVMYVVYMYPAHIRPKAISYVWYFSTFVEDSQKQKQQEKQIRALVYTLRWVFNRKQYSISNCTDSQVWEIRTWESMPWNYLNPRSRKIRSWKPK